MRPEYELHHVRVASMVGGRNIMHGNTFSLNNLLAVVRYRENVAHIRQSRPDIWPCFSGLSSLNRSNCSLLSPQRLGRLILFDDCWRGSEWRSTKARSITMSHAAHQHDGTLQKCWGVWVVSGIGDTSRRLEMEG